LAPACFLPVKHAGFTDISGNADRIYDEKGFSGWNSMGPDESFTDRANQTSNVQPFEPGENLLPWKKVIVKRMDPAGFEPAASTLRT
jgi:hypothetical protein